MVTKLLLEVEIMDQSDAESIQKSLADTLPQLRLIGCFVKQAKNER